MADEEAGGADGARGLVAARPELFADDAGRPAAAAINEVGGYSMSVGGRRFYTVQVAEKGIVWTRLRSTGTPGHGSMPHADNAAVKLAAAVGALVADQAERPARVIPLVAEFLEAMGLGEVARLAATDPEAASAALERGLSDPILRRSIDAMLRDTVTPNVLRAGKKVNVIPGAGEAEVDVRTLPGTDQAGLLSHLASRRRRQRGGRGGRHPARGGVAGRRRDRAAHVRCPSRGGSGRDARADDDHARDRCEGAVELGIPCYGFSPLRLDPDMPFLSLFHGHDERRPGQRAGLRPAGPGGRGRPLRGSTLSS